MPRLFLLPRQRFRTLGLLRKHVFWRILPFFQSHPQQIRPADSRSRWELVPRSMEKGENGEGGIRTPGAGLAHTRFPSVHLKPLGHLSRK